jgi:glycosyltransferase involved in cell wall biosynthesis
MACGTPAAALDRGAVREVVEPGVTGGIFGDLNAMVEGLEVVMALDRKRIRERAVQRFGIGPMVEGYVQAFRTIIEQQAR